MLVNKNLSENRKSISSKVGRSNCADLKSCRTLAALQNFWSFSKCLTVGDTFGSQLLAVGLCTNKVCVA